LYPTKSLTPVISIHCNNAQNVGFENPTYAKLFRRSPMSPENVSKP
jgi:hypothetical protein